MPKSKPIRKIFSKNLLTRNIASEYRSSEYNLSNLENSTTDSENSDSSSKSIAPQKTESTVIEQLSLDLNNLEIIENQPSKNLDIKHSLKPEHTTITTMTTPSYQINPFKCVELLPQFSGQVGTLNNFVAQVDIYYQLVPEADTLGRNVMNGLIRNKITGEASNSLVSIGNPLNWVTIKNHLLNYFSDKRSVDHLKRKLTELVQRNKSLEDYFSEASDLQTALINTVDPSLPPSEKQYYIRDTSREVLREFLLGLRPELSNFVRPQNPQNIKEAFDQARNQETYLQGQQAKLGLRQQSDRLTTNYKPQQSRNQQYTHSRQWQPNFQQTSFKPPPHQLNAPRFNPNPNPQNPFYNTRQPFFKPPQFSQRPGQNFQFNRPNYQSQPQNFPQKPRLPEPTPMDISTQTRQNQPTGHRFFPSTGQKPNFTFRELHAQEPNQQVVENDFDFDQNYPDSTPIEEQNYPYDNFDYGEYDWYQQQGMAEPEIDDRNFPSTSHPPSKT